jgi:N-acetyl-gamma-glutamylphosphate reductase
LCEFTGTVRCLKSSLSPTRISDIGWKFDVARSNLILISAIDNIGKGAAGKAIRT